MQDTDSMAIVATEAGGLVTCPGGPYRNGDGQEAVNALSWTQVRDIVGMFGVLNPFDRDVVPGSILKIEQDNFDPSTGQQRLIYCFAISAKRYALFVYDDRDEPELLQKGVNSATDRWSEHGLGHLLNPTDPDSADRAWTRQIWLYVIREALGFKVSKHTRFDRPAYSRVTVSGPGS